MYKGNNLFKNQHIILSPFNLTYLLMRRGGFHSKIKNLQFCWYTLNFCVTFLEMISLFSHIKKNSLFYVITVAILQKENFVKWVQMKRAIWISLEVLIKSPVEKNNYGIWKNCGILFLRNCMKPIKQSSDILYILMAFYFSKQPLFCQCRRSGQNLLFLLPLGLPESKLGLKLQSMS